MNEMLNYIFKSMNRNERQIASLSRRMTRTAGSNAEMIGKLCKAVKRNNTQITLLSIIIIAMESVNLIQERQIKSLNDSIRELKCQRGVTEDA